MQNLNKNKYTYLIPFLPKCSIIVSIVPETNSNIVCAWFWFKIVVDISLLQIWH